MTDPAPPQYNWQTIVQFFLINFPTEPLLSYSAIIVILFLNWDLVNNRTRMLQMTFTLHETTVIRNLTLQPEKNTKNEPKT
jgi:hypothetical protein